MVETLCAWWLLKMLIMIYIVLVSQKQHIVDMVDTLKEKRERDSERKRKDEEE